MSMFGTINNTNVDAVTVDGTQTVHGRKIFSNGNNFISGYMNEPTIIAESLPITPLAISFLHNVQSNIQDQLDALDNTTLPLAQALQALRPAPNANTVQFDNNILLNDGTNNAAFYPLGISLNNGSSSASWASIIAGGPTSNLSDVLAAGNIATGSTAKITLSNSAAGGNANPMLTLNQNDTNAGAGSLRFFKNISTNGSAIGELSFVAKTAIAGNPEREYARIETRIRNNNSGNVDGSIGLSTRINDTLVEFLSLNGNANHVDIFRTLHTNGNAIINVPSISTPSLNQYGKNTVQFYSGDANFPPYAPEDRLRLTLINEGVPDAVLPLAASFPGPWGTITCSADFNSSTYVGTKSGYVYFSSDGVAWNNINDSFNGRILCMTVYNGELYVGGDFTMMTSSGTPVFRIARVDSSGNVYQVNFSNYMGSAGFNSEVRCFCAGVSGYLYVGGTFTSDDQNILSCPYMAVIDSSFNLYCIDNSSGTGYGPNGAVNFIAENPSYAPYFFVIGGEFTYFTVASGGYSTAYNAVWKCNANFDSDPSFTPYEVASMNSYPRCITLNGSRFYIGGDFTGLTYGNYLATFEWNGSAFQLVANEYGATPSYPIVAVYQNGGIYWSQSNGEFFDAGNSIATAPFSSAFSWIYRTVWGQLLISTESGLQDPYIAYYFFTADVITLTLTIGVIYNGASTYSGGVILYNTGALVDLMFQAAYNRWYVVNLLGAGFF